MPTAVVDDCGSALYYEDSGQPSTSNSYITLVMIHGTCFHSASFKPLINPAKERKLRLVLINLRGYPGSTPYSDAEIQLFGGTPDEQEAACQSWGLELAAFLVWFIEHENISQICTPADDNHSSGGISILAWSGGNGQTLPLFAYADKLPKSTRVLLESYLRSFIMYDPSYSAVGIPPPPGLRTFVPNPTFSPEEQTIQFGLAVSAYYPSFALPDGSYLTTNYAPRKPLRDRTPTTAKFTYKQLRALTHPPIFERVQHALWTPKLRSLFEANAFRALFDCRLLDDGSGVKKVWPRLTMHVVWCDMSAGELTWAAAVLRSKYTESDPEARRVVEFHKMEGVNHFVHMEEPQRFMELIAELV